MRIGELARQTGVSVRSLRYYEEQGLLAAERSESGQRHYPDAAAERVRMIQKLYASGLTSQSIRDMLPCLAVGEVAPELLEVLADHRDRIDGRIRDLQEARTRLNEIIDSAEAARASDRPWCQECDAEQVAAAAVVPVTSVRRAHPAEHGRPATG